MLRKTLSALVLSPLLAFGLPAQAQDSDVDRLYDLLGFPELLPIMVEEGRSYGDQIRDDLFPGRGGAVWQAEVDRIYDSGRMGETVRAEFAAALDGTDIGPMIDFFGSPRGERIVALELSAREAMLDDSVEEAALEAFARLANEDPGRVALLREYAEVNGLVESNVVGTLNSNFAFYKGLGAGGAFPGGMTDSEIAGDVWAQEAAIRESTVDWVYSYTALAYGPLDDDDLAAYVAFSRSEAGQEITRAIFAAFDVLFVDISRDLGLAAAQLVGGQEL
ncbi:DUF2059 domain-containing protein [Anianabacter salinae]|uniref:DUF2059 domain-containing protein n=1 Tax=Anianabacter salinae TaxID=2851023 RepID=UPI00225DD2DF|nr:DUF2059 domain-containing protein [Anianabacter salinae]MBV0911948.1 DUF2059 domain-containing protein [Anianabacter salinae]